MSTKYKNKKSEIDGFKFDSKAEMNRYLELVMMQKSRMISELEVQVEFDLIPTQQGERAVKYLADFVYKKNGETIVEDVKGVKTRDYILKRKMMLFFHGIKIQEITK